MKYNRYRNFISDGAYLSIPFIEVPESQSDCYVYYEVGKTRLDLLSYQFYNDPNFGWLILQANPQYGSLEFLLDTNIKLRIPYRLEIALQKYEEEIKKYDKLYGVKN